MVKLDPETAISNQRMMDHFDFLDTRLKNRALSAAGLAIGTSATTAVKITNTVSYTSGSPFKSKATAEVAFTAGTHDIPASLAGPQERVYLLTLDAAGAPTITAGDIATIGATTPANGVAPPGILTNGVVTNATTPGRPATGTPIGYVRIRVASAAPGTGTNFVAGTTALSDARLTAVTYTDVSDYGARFDTAQ